MSKSNKTRTIKVDYLARVEGEGGVLVRIRGGKLAEVKLHIFEPPRFFEAFLRGRKFDEAPDITARICGICPIAYQMSAAHAIETACGVTVRGQLRALRRLIYCGEWIESHALHVFLLHAPDFLGYEDALQMVKRHGAFVQHGLQLKKLGNEIVAMLGGREIHPVNVRVGGFYRIPTKAEFIRWLRSSIVRVPKLLPQHVQLQGSSSPISSRTMNSLRCGTRTNTRSTKAGSFQTRDSTYQSRHFSTILARNMCHTQPRCIVCAKDAAIIS